MSEASATAERSSSYSAFVILHSEFPRKGGSPMTSQNDYDVIIIGTGAGGGTLAYRLAPSGKRILLLERGDFLRREPDNWDSRAVFVRNKYKTHETWYDKHGQAFH